jgi:MazG family protein
VARLRAEGGCPWDREQTLETLKPFLLEEVYELLEALDAADPAAHAEELGDVLLQVVFQAQVRAEAGIFTLDDVAHRVSDKLIRRHPHVFGDTVAPDSAAVLRNWERIKRRERSEAAAPRSALAGVPASLPALLRAQHVQTRAARVGFDWPDAAGASAKIDEELAELRRAAAVADREAVRHEAGDLLFSVVNLCRFLRIDAEDALRLTVDRFQRRFREVEERVAAEGRELRACTPAELDAHWEAVKRRETEAPTAASRAESAPSPARRSAAPPAGP